MSYHVEKLTSRPQMRENFSKETIHNLAERAGNVCSFPGCRAPTSGPSEESPTKTARTGVAAHICAASQGKGARRRLDISSFDKKLLSNYSNGIWMCGKHATLIDTDEVRFTVDMLRRWRELAELRAKLSHETKRPVEVHLREGHEIPLAEVRKSVIRADTDIDATLNINGVITDDLCNAVLDSCIEDVWGKDIGHAVRDLAGELMLNAFQHGANHFHLDIDLNHVIIKSDDEPFSFGELLADPQHNGGQSAAASMTKLTDRLLTSYRRENGFNILEIAFISSAEQVLVTTTCSIGYRDFISHLESYDQLPAMYSDCETIYIVVKPRQHLIPSVARRLIERLQKLADQQKRIVLIGSSISDGVISLLKGTFPDLQVMEVAS
jgi:hypothetical protein